MPGFGLTYVKNLVGAVTQEVLNTYVFDAATLNTVSIFQNDPVMLTGAGYAEGNAITIAATTKPVVGVAKGFNYIDAKGNPVYSNKFVAGTQIKTGTLVNVEVADDPNIIWAIQASAPINKDVQAALNAPFSIGNGNSITGISGAMLNVTGIANTATLDLKIYGLASPVRFPGNSFAAANPIVLVRLNNHSYANQVVGIP